MKKTLKTIKETEDAIKIIQDNGIAFHPSIILGFDTDTKAIFDDTLAFLARTRLPTMALHVLTPYPGTKVRERLLAEDRILSSDWRNYDMEHVNFRPKGMTVEELERGYDELTRRFYSFGSMWRRLSLHRSLPAFGPMNFGFRSALKHKVADA